MEEGLYDMNWGFLGTYEKGVGQECIHDDDSIERMDLEALYPDVFFSFRFWWMLCVDEIGRCRLMRLGIVCKAAVDI